ncbi:MAG: thiamine phosphate synthase [Campylobacteraceae bacterium]|nr:thiamine phosphate synthase [Campylobacteraceae bacterium]
MNKIAKLKLYALIDKATLKKNGKSLEWIVQRAKSFDASLLQYRNKTGDFDEKKEDLLSIRKLCNDIPLIINDDITLIDYCDGIHLGQDDILNFANDINKAASLVRDIIGTKKLFGLSTHNTEEIVTANCLPIDYIGLGAYRKTNTKDTANILGDTLDLLAKFSKKPVAAIGGVKPHDEFKHVTYLVVGSGLYENYSILH